MTMPGGVDNVTIPEGLPELLFPMGPPNTFARGVSSGHNLTREAVEEQLKLDKVVNNPRLRGPKAGVDNLFGDIAAAFQQAAANTWEFLLMLPVIGDALEVITGREDGNLDDLGTVINRFKQNFQDQFNLLVNGLLGWDLWNAGAGEAEQAVKDAAETIAGLSAAVTALENNRNNQAVGGVADMIDFTLRPSGSTFGVDFNHIRTGGAGHYAIVNGVGAQWDSVSDADAIDDFTYLEATATDYQKVWVAFGAAPVEWYGNQAVNEIHGRKNAAGNTRVYARLTKWTAQLGCDVAGARTVFVTKTFGFSFKSNALYALECGTIGALRIFRLLEGNKVILTHTEVGTTSQLGADYRLSGGIGKAIASGLGTTPPGLMWAFAVSDNQPAPVLGTGVELFRASPSLVGISMGTHELPGDFWDNLRAATNDVSWSLTTGRIKVSQPGWYDIEARIMTDSSAWPNHFMLALFKGGVYEKLMGDDHPQPGIGGAIRPYGVSGRTRVYLDIDDEVGIGYTSSSGEGKLRGEASGAESYVSLVRTGVRG